MSGMLTVDIQVLMVGLLVLYIRHRSGGLCLPVVVEHTPRSRLIVAGWFYLSGVSLGGKEDKVRCVW